MWQAYLRFLIRERMRKVRASNHRISLRSYAAKIGISPGGLSSWLNGNRGISLRKGKILFENISPTAEERGKFHQLTESFLSGGESDPRGWAPSHWDWRHLAIVSWFSLKRAKTEKTSVAEAFGIPEKEAEEIVRQLLSEGVLTREEASDSVVSIAGALPFRIHPGFAEENLVIGQGGFLLTFASDPRNIGSLYRFLEGLLLKFPDMTDPEEATGVYQVSFQILPLVKNN